MRIISGSLKGKKLFSPKKQCLRPTSDRVKETIFNVLSGLIEGKVVLDLYAGTGSLGIEALSRGAKRAVFVEKGRQAIRLIERNLAQCGFKINSEIISKDVNRVIGILKSKGESFDIIIMDPPYEKGLIEKTLKKLQSERIYHEESILVIEHDRREPILEDSYGWQLFRQIKIGDTLISFLIPTEKGGNPIK